MLEMMSFAKINTIYYMYIQFYYNIQRIKRDIKTVNDSAIESRLRI